MNYVPLHKRPSVPMSNDNTQFMMALMLRPDVVNMDAIKETHIYQILDGRLNAFGVPVQDSIKAFIAIGLCDGRPGIAVMYAYSLLVRYKEVNKEIDWDVFCLMFPTGFPDESELDKAWDDQKQRGAPAGNWLDSPEAVL